MNVVKLKVDMLTDQRTTLLTIKETTASVNHESNDISANFRPNINKRTLELAEKKVTFQNIIFTI